MQDWVNLPEWITPSLLCSTLSFFLGLWIGHRYALGRDRRNEFNAVGVRLRDRLLAPGGDEGLPIRDVFEIRLRMGRWRRGFDRAVQRYEASRGEDNLYQDEDGRVFYKDAASVQKAIAQLLPYLHWK